MEKRQGFNILGERWQQKRQSLTERLRHNSSWKICTFTIHHHHNEIFYILQLTIIGWNPRGVIFLSDISRPVFIGGV